MKSRFKIFLHTVLIAMSFGLAQCDGDSGSSIRIVLANGQSYEFSIDNAQCYASVPAGGFLSLPLTCTGAFTSSGGIADGLLVNITDVRVVEDQLGLFIPFSINLLTMTLTLDGVQQAIIDGGAVFSRVSNTVGGTTCFEFEANSVQGTFEGSYCGNTGTGFCPTLGGCF